MDGAIDAAAAQHALVGRVDDGVDAQLRDVAHEEGHLAGQRVRVAVTAVLGPGRDVLKAGRER